MPTTLLLRLDSGLRDRVQGTADTAAIALLPDEEDEQNNQERQPDAE